MSAQSSYVHPTAIVEAGSLIGEGSKVWHHSHIRSSASVGANCVIGKNVFVDAHAIVGDRCKLQNNVCVYDGVTLGDDVFVGPAATFTNDRVPRAFNTSWVITPTRVENGASIGANATIVCGTTIGEYAMVAAGSTVTKNVASHQLVGGTPAHHLGWVCRCGEVVARDQAPPDHLVCSRCSS